MRPQRPAARHGLAVLAAIALPLVAPLGGAAGGVEERAELARQPYIGLRIAGAYGARVSIDPVPGGPAAAAGVDYGDIVFSLNDEAVATPTELLDRLKALKVGDEVLLELSNAGRRRTARFTLPPLPFERAPEGVGLVYDAVDAAGGRVRTITTRPTGDGPFPGVLFVQGMACGSIEETVGEPSPRLRFVHDLTSAGFCVMRVEKPGEGDSTGTPCRDLGFDEEAEVFRTALAALAAYEFVDEGSVFVFGRAAGTKVAPRLAAGEGPKVRGVIAYAPEVRPFAELDVESVRRQTRLQMTTLDRVASSHALLADATRTLARFHHYTLVDDLSIDEVIDAHPELETFAQSLFPDGERSRTRSLGYFQELNDARTVEAWGGAAVPVLALRGGVDWVAPAEDAELLVEIVNRLRPGTATLEELPGVFHDFNAYASIEAALTEPPPGEYAPGVAAAAAAWMRARLAEPPAPASP